jgi:hypothetical protein
MSDYCHYCGKERDGHWALLFSAPNKDGMCIKTHVCNKCYGVLIHAVKA